MALEDSVNDLVDATTDLLTAVNVSKATLDASVASAAGSATTTTANATAASASQSAAATSATNAANSATQAANSAASAAAIVTGVASNRPSIRPSLLLDFEHTKQLDPRITFSRPTTATYYDGKTVVKAEENLVKYSEQFDNAAWAKAGSLTVTANSTTAPDGNATADTATAGNSTSYLYTDPQGSNLSIGTYTFSCYLKAGTNNYAALNIQGNSTSWATAVFDLVNGLVTQTAIGSSGSVAIVSTGISAVGSSWYRCTIAVSCTSSVLRYTSVMFAATATGNTLSAAYGEPSGNTIGNTLYAWGAQLEQRSTVTAYTPTTTAPITNYIPALQTAVSNDARFDHEPVTGESKGLLIEEQRTNLVTYSNAFATSPWGATASTVSVNSNVSPDGTQTAALLVDSSANTTHYVYQPQVVTATAYTLSVFMKAAGRTQGYLDFTGGINRAIFDLSAGTVVSSTGTGLTASIVSVGNGWYRCSVTQTQASGTIYPTIGTASGGAMSYAGNGYSGIYIWGAQLEAGSFPTSYIPTVVSQVTRSADSASMAGSNFSSWYRADEGTLYGESQPLAGTLTTIIGGASDGTLNNFTRVSGAYLIGYTARSVKNGVAQMSIGPIATGGMQKYSYAYKLNDSALSVDGAAVLTDTSCEIPTVSQFDIGKAGSTLAAGTVGNGTIKRIAYYPKRLSNTELQGLTS